MRMLTLLIVFARLPFNIVLDPVFRAFVCFLDPLVPFPTRSEITGKHLSTLRDDTEASLKSLRALLRTVHGALLQLTRGNWNMAKKIDDILSLDVHFITDGFI